MIGHVRSGLSPERIREIVGEAVELMVESMTTIDPRAFVDKEAIREWHNVIVDQSVEYGGASVMKDQDRELAALLQLAGAALVMFTLKKGRFNGN